MKPELSWGRLMALIAGALILTATLTIGAVADEEMEDEEMVEWADVPEAVQEVIESHLPAAVGQPVEVEIEHGITVYEAEIESEDGEMSIEVSEAGEVLEIESEGQLAWDDVPEAVRSAIESHLPAAVGQPVEVEVEDGITVYEAEIEGEDGEMSIEVSEAGDLIELEESVSPDALPAAVLAAIERVAPGAEIREAEWAQEFSYEAELVIDGREIEIEISPAGQIEDDEDDDEECEHGERGEHGHGECEHEEGEHGECEHGEGEHEEADEV